MKFIFSEQFENYVITVFLCASNAWGESKSFFLSSFWERFFEINISVFSWVQKILWVPKLFQTQYQLFINPILTLYWPYTKHIPTLYWLYTSSICHTCHICRTCHTCRTICPLFPEPVLNMKKMELFPINNYQNWGKLLFKYHLKFLRKFHSLFV